MLRGTGEEREGVLLRRLKEVGHGTRPGGFGFTTGAEGGPTRRAMLVVARVARVGEVAAAAEAGADAVEIALGRGADTAAVAKAIGGVGVPCGVFVEGDLDPAALEGSAKLDWIHAAAEAPARLLAGKGPTRLISLGPDTPSGRLPGLSSLTVDVAVIDGTGTTAFTVDTLLALRTIQGATRGPALAGSGLGITPDDVEVLHDAGIEGVLVTGDPATVRAFVTAIEALDSR